jgi:hypothetical protein
MQKILGPAIGGNDREIKVIAPTTTAEKKPTNSPEVSTERHL